MDFWKVKVLGSWRGGLSTSLGTTLDYWKVVQMVMAELVFS